MQHAARADKQSTYHCRQHKGQHMLETSNTVITPDIKLQSNLANSNIVNSNTTLGQIIYLYFYLPW